MSGAPPIIVPEAAIASPPAPALLPGELQAPHPARSLTWTDAPDDAGRAVDLSWEPSPDDDGLHVLVDGYYLMRSESPGGPWTLVDSVAAGVATSRDQSASLRRDVAYFYRVDTHGPGGVTPAGSVTGPAFASVAVVQPHALERAAADHVLLRLRAVLHPERAGRGKEARSSGASPASTPSRRPSAGRRRWGARCSTCPACRTSRTCRPCRR